MAYVCSLLRFWISACAPRTSLKRWVTFASDLLPRALIKVMLKSRSFLRAWQGKTAIARVASCRRSDDKSDVALKRFEMLNIPREVGH